jgi:hypothetical protein
MLEKLFGGGSFDGFIGHLVRHQAIFPASSGKLGLPFIVQTFALTFLRCWTLITRALVTHFQQDDTLILLDVIAHVEINISSF